MRLILASSTKNRSKHCCTPGVKANDVRVITGPKQGCFDGSVPMWGWSRDDDDILDSVLDVIGVTAGVLGGTAVGIDSVPVQGVGLKVFAVSEGHSAWGARKRWVSVSSRLRGVVEEDVGVVWWRFVFDFVIRRCIVVWRCTVVWPICLIQFDKVG